MLGMRATPDAIAQKATVEGHARAEEGGAPVQFALVRLVRADSSPLPSDSPPQGITNADGRYRFDGVAPGRYRVQLLRIGFRPVLSDPVQVAAGETVQLELRVASQPLMLPPGHRHSGRLRAGKEPQGTPTAPDALATSARWRVGAHRAHGTIPLPRVDARGVIRTRKPTVPPRRARSISPTSATPSGQSRTPRATGSSGSHAATTVQQHGDGFYVPNELDVCTRTS